MKTQTFTLVAMLMAAEVLPVAGWTQVLTTGGTVGSSINNGANIGAGNHTGASVNLDNNVTEAGQIRGKLGVQGTTTARQNTLMGQNTTAVDGATTTPAEMGATGSVHGNTHTATEVKGAATVADILPRGSASYTYYPEAQVYFAPTSKTYYYSQRGRWYSSTNLPAGIKLGNSRTMQLTGNGAASVTTP